MVAPLGVGLSYDTSLMVWKIGCITNITCTSRQRIYRFAEIRGALNHFSEARRPTELRATVTRETRPAPLTETADPEPPLRRLQYENRKEAAKA